MKFIFKEIIENVISVCKPNYTVLKLISTDDNKLEKKNMNIESNNSKLKTNYYCPNDCIMKMVMRQNLGRTNQTFSKYLEECGLINLYIYFTEKCPKRFCANHDDYSDLGYYCEKCDFFLCFACLNIDFDKECVEKHLTFWSCYMEEYCFKHKGNSRSGFHCKEGHFTLYL